MEYIRRAFDTKAMGLEKSLIRLYPIVCLHLGAAQCDIKFIREHIRRIKNDPNGYWIYMGDGGECVTKLSKGGLYEQLLSPQHQQDMLIELLDPIRDKGLFGIRGNHGNRIDKESGLSFDKTLCVGLGIPYMGVSTMLNLVVNRSSYDLFFHHGATSGSALQSKVSRAEVFGKFIDADALFTAHSHVAMELQPSAILSCDNTTKTIRTKLRKQYICGSAYDSRSGYAEEAAYSPILPSYLAVTFDGRIIEGKAIKRQHTTRYESDGQYKLEHDYLERILVG
jgi:hypothetical protein